jgi:hypothetical protein
MKRLDLQLFVLIRGTNSLALNEYRRILVIVGIKINKFIVQKTIFFVTQQYKFTFALKYSLIFYKNQPEFIFRLFYN